MYLFGAFFVYSVRQKNVYFGFVFNYEESKKNAFVKAVPNFKL